MEYMNGVMEEDMKENGNMENNMEKDYMLLEKLKEQENGWMENELDGMMKRERIIKNEFEITKIYQYSTI